MFAASPTAEACDHYPLCEEETMVITFDEEVEMLGS